MPIQHMAVVIARDCIVLTDEYRHRPAAASSQVAEAINSAYEVEKIINLTSHTPTGHHYSMRLPVIGFVGVVGRITGRLLPRCPSE